MNGHPLSAEITSTPDGMRVWQQERVIFEVTERLCELMKEQNVTRAELAKRLGKKSRPYITQVLSGNANLTLRTLSDIYLSLGRQFCPGDGPITLDHHDCEMIFPIVFQDDDDAIPETDEAILWKVEKHG